MDELLAKATQGVDPESPGATWNIIANQMALVPWGPLIWLTVGFTVVGGVLGWWRGRFWLGVSSAFILGPFGWLVVLMVRPPAKGPPALPRGR